MSAVILSVSVMSLTRSKYVAKVSIITSQPFFCSSLAKSKPTWLCPKELRFKAKNYFLYTTIDRTTFQHCSGIVYISSSRFHCEYVHIFCFQAKCLIVLDPFSSYCNFPQSYSVRKSFAWNKGNRTLINCMLICSSTIWAMQWTSHVGNLGDQLC